MAFAYSELRQPETALYYLDKTDSLECDHVNISIIKGHVLLSNKRAKEAEEIFKKALINSGNAPKTMLRIIVSLYDNHFVLPSYKLLKGFLTLVDDDWKEGYSYMALCCLDLKKYDEFLQYLKQAIEKNPREVRLVLGSYFPKEVELKDYYDYMKKKLKSKLK